MATKLAFPARTIPWTVRRDGDDLIVSNARVTCFGGADDPQDNGETSSGINTKKLPTFEGVSLPMDGRAFKTSNRAFHAAIDGSPLPRVPWFTTVIMEQVGGVRVPASQRVPLPVIDVGPRLDTGNALDMTVAAARRFRANATARNFELLNCTFRIVGGAKKAMPVL